MKNRYSKFSIYIYLLFCVAFLSGFIKGDSDFYHKISRSIDTFGQVYKQVLINYVDEIDPEIFMEVGIEKMLAYLDPYTNYIDASHQKDIEVITKGKYGGIGASIGIREESVVIVDLIEGYSAQRQGLRIGDVILEIDTIKLNKSNYDTLGNLVLGKPGTTLHLIIKREGKEHPIEFNFVREEIELKNLSYYGFIPKESNNAYLKLSGFSRTAGTEVREALLKMSALKKIETIVLDLRGNPGGLLDAAINVSEQFLKQGDLIVSVIKRDTANIFKTYSDEKPTAGKEPLVVLINSGSASSAEIVTGALQDHDRAVIVGEPSFGKGLVQTVIPISFNTSLKITTAKYYTPSGRCIQEIDYSKKHKLITGKANKKNKEYRTDNNRLVKADGGILPDVKISGLSKSEQIRSLIAQGVFFEFATSYYNSDESISLEKINKEKLFNDFLKYKNLKKVKYTSEAERLLNKFKTAVKENNYKQEFKDKVDSILKELDMEEEKELITYKDEVIQNIFEELSGRISGEKGRIIQSLKNDLQFEKALEILNNKEKYYSILNYKN